MNQRKWITREEIAEIYDSLAKRASQAAFESMPSHRATLEELNVASGHMSRTLMFQQKAHDVRQIEELKPLVWENGSYHRSGRNNW